MSAPHPTRILVWMCVLIAVNQLGFGSIVPVLALYARSFGVTQWAIGFAIAVYGLMGMMAAGVAWWQIPETRASGLSAADATTPPFAAQVRLLMRHAGFVLVALVAFMNAVARTGALFNVIPVLARDRLALSA